MLRPYKQGCGARINLQAASKNSGTHTHDKKARAAHRLELFQEADAAEARQILAECPAAVARAHVDRRTYYFQRLARLQQRTFVRAARHS